MDYDWLGASPNIAGTVPVLELHPNSQGSWTQPSAFINNISFVRTGQLDDLKYRTVISRPGLCPDPAGERNSAHSDYVADGEDACCSLSKNPPRSRPFGPSYLTTIFVLLTPSFVLLKISLVVWVRVEVPDQFVAHVAQD